MFIHGLSLAELTLNETLVQKKSWKGEREGK